MELHGLNLIAEQKNITLGTPPEMPRFYWRRYSLSPFYFLVDESQASPSGILKDKSGFGRFWENPSEFVQFGEREIMVLLMVRSGPSSPSEEI